MVIIHSSANMSSPHPTLTVRGFSN
uniref:Uncharacterized protein n=1 Tax=Rhizophora mucronata TaxID=61149 RepID=A0A2P2Q0A7_RHIMU